jgi:hypothetical protein
MAAAATNTAGGASQMARIAAIARSAWTQAQSTAVFALCIGAGMVLPVALASLGFQSF